MAKTLLLILMLALMAVSVSALSCKPSINDFVPGEKISYLCQNVSAATCYVTVYTDTENGSLIDAFPKTLFSEAGYTNGFRVIHNISVVQIKTNNIKADRSYNLTFHCGLNTYNVTTNFVYSSFLAAPRAGVWAVVNARSLVGVFFILLILAILAGLYWRAIKEGLQ